MERGTRPVELTEAGHALTRHATGIFARLDGVEQELGEIAGRRHGRLRFGSFPTALATFVPPAFVDFRRRHAEVTLTVVDDHLQRLIPRLEAGELDLALIYDHEALPEIAARDLERIPLLDDAFRAILPAGHRLARRRRPLELSDLAGEPWVGGAPTSAWFRVTSHACRVAGFAPQVGFASDDYIALQALVAAGLGVSVIPGLAVAHPLPGLAVRTLGSGAPVRHISAARPRDAYLAPPSPRCSTACAARQRPSRSTPTATIATDADRAPLPTTQAPSGRRLSWLRSSEPQRSRPARAVAAPPPVARRRRAGSGPVHSGAIDHAAFQQSAPEL